MSLPDLCDWDFTRVALHAASQVLGGVRSSTLEPHPNGLHFSLIPTQEGISTGSLPWGGELFLDFGRTEVWLQWDDREEAIASLEGMTQAELASKLRSRMADLGHEQESIPLKSPHEGRLMPEPAQAREYLDVLRQVRTGLALFRGHLGGYLTPIVVWPHHFDLAFLWFPGEGRDEHRDPHMAFGFAPWSYGFPRPYVYAYAWPSPERLTELPLPSPGRWYSEGWTGAVLDYDSLVCFDDPVSTLESALLEIWARIAPLLAAHE